LTHAWWQPWCDRVTLTTVTSHVARGHLEFPAIPRSGLDHLDAWRLLGFLGLMLGAEHQASCFYSA